MNYFISLFLYVQRGTVRFCGVFNIHIHCFNNVPFYMNQYCFVFLSSDIVTTLSGATK